MPDSALGSLFKRGILTDITLVVEGKEIPTHRAILAAHSPFFEGLFTSGMSETNESKVTLHSPFRYRATYQIIAYLYDGMTYEQNFNAAETKVDFELLWDTFLLAEYLTLPVIQQKMVPYLLQGLNRETALQILQSSYGKIDKSWAKLHGDVFHFVAAHCVEFLKDFPDVMRTLEKPLLMDIIRAACLKTCVRGNGFQTSEIDTIVGFLKNYTNCDSMAGLLGLCKNWPSKRYKPAVTCWQVPNWMHVLRGGRVPTMSVRTDSLLLHFKLKRMSETEIAVVQEICRPSSARSDDDGRLSLYSCAHTEFSIWKKQPPDFGNSSTEEDVNVTSLTCCSTLGDYPVRSSSREIRHTIYNTDFGTGLQHPENDGGDESIHLVEDLCWSEQNRSWYDIVSMSTALETPGGGTGALYVRLSVSENPIAAVLMEHISANFIHFWRTEQIILDLDTTERECLINAVCNASMTSDDENKPEGEGASVNKASTMPRDPRPGRVRSQGTDKQCNNRRRRLSEDDAQDFHFAG
eukprot:GEMP01023220.1.p1 GENE.GEMP01023220.1~~GEMP01023220.1.p1  ORF type:complete len:538 (+),score=98.17 GEMP01023220.1:52-1614(+)